MAVLHDSGSHKGPRNRLIRSVASSSGVLITSYNAVVSHKDALLEQDFQYIILDEGHKIRNPDAQITLTAKMFPTPHRLILSGPGQLCFNVLLDSGHKFDVLIVNRLAITK